MPQVYNKFLSQQTSRLTISALNRQRLSIFSIPRKTDIARSEIILDSSPELNRHLHINHEFIEKLYSGRAYALQIPVIILPLTHC